MAGRLSFVNIARRVPSPEQKRLFTAVDIVDGNPGEWRSIGAMTSEEDASAAAPAKVTPLSGSATR
jgi:hypothetical protein